MTAIPHIHSTGHSPGHPGSLFHHAIARKEHDPKLVKQVQRLVSQTFYAAILKQMHNSPFKSKLLDGGHGSDGFSSMLDQHLADRMAGRSGMNSLVDAIATKLESRASTRKRSCCLKKSAVQRRFQNNGYLKPAAANRGGSQNVPTSLRA